MDITVAIPTFNGADRLPEVLRQLQGQEQTDSIEWEIRNGYLSKKIVMAFMKKVGRRCGDCHLRCLCENLL
jgi:hypothetical protein